MRQNDIFILVFSINSKISFEEIGQYREQILRVKDTDVVPIILVAAKSDLEKEREISKIEAQEFAKTHSLVYMETSAKEGKNINLLFENAIRLVTGRNVITFEKIKWTKDLHFTFPDIFKEKTVCFVLSLNRIRLDAKDKKVSTKVNSIKLPKPIVQYIVYFFSIFEGDGLY